MELSLVQSPEPWRVAALQRGPAWTTLAYVSTQRRVARLSDRSAEIVRILALENDPSVDVDRITQFISLLGFDRVRRAAEYTSSRKPPGGIGNPWWYVVGVINQNSARTSYLYTLIHWVELALRASLDCALSERFGGDWHRVDPPAYLSQRSVIPLWKDYERYQQQQASRAWVGGDDQPRLKWQLDVVTKSYIPQYESPEDFLDALDFHSISEMVLYAYEVRAPRVAPILFAPDGTQMPVGSARAELRWLRQIVRNAVMHNRSDGLSGIVFELDDFVQTANRVERALRALRYHTCPALARHELKRMAVVDAAVQRMEKRRLVDVIAEVQAGKS